MSNNSSFKDTKVYFHKNRFYLPKNSMIKNVNSKSEFTQVDQVFKSLTDVAKFVTGDEKMDIGFFKL